MPIWLYLDRNLVQGKVGHLFCKHFLSLVEILSPSIKSSRKKNPSVCGLAGPKETQSVIVQSEWKDWSVYLSVTNCPACLPMLSLHMATVISQRVIPTQALKLKGIVQWTILIWVEYKCRGLWTLVWHHTNSMEACCIFVCLNRGLYLPQFYWIWLQHCLPLNLQKCCVVVDNKWICISSVNYPFNVINFLGKLICVITSYQSTLPQFFFCTPPGTRSDTWLTFIFPCV